MLSISMLWKVALYAAMSSAALHEQLPCEKRDEEMTKRATIGQGDIERALKACKRAGYDKARVHINVRAQTIDIMLGEDQAKGPPAYNPWDEDFDL